MKFLDIIETLDELEDHRENGMPGGISTGWGWMDRYYTILKEQLIVVSGFPGHGKSEWIENIAVHLAKVEDWTILMYCPESHPASKHTRSLAEKWAGKQMLDDYNNAPKMSSEDLAAAVYDINKKFRIISADLNPHSFEEILEMAIRIKREGKPLDMLIIDPWNELESNRPPGVSETEYIGRCLERGRRVARSLGILLAIVCHPAKPSQKNKDGLYDPPDPYDLAGSAHWFNRSDNLFITHRYDKFGVRVVVLVKKIKNRHYGELGEVEFDFDPASSRFIKPKAGDENL